MFVLNYKLFRFLLLAALGLIACMVMQTTTTGGTWPAGEPYHFTCASGSVGLWTGGYGPAFTTLSGQMRSFGSIPTQHFSSSILVESFSDATDTTGLPSDQVRLVFNLASSTGSGLLDGGVLGLYHFQLPPGATYLEDSARITFTFSSGAPLTVGPTFDGAPIFLPYVSGAGSNVPGLSEGATFDGSQVSSGLTGITSMTYEIVVDNLPEPFTLGLFASGALLLTGRLVARNRRKA